MFINDEYECKNPAVRALIEYLAELTVDGVATYGDLAAAAGVPDLQGRERWLLLQARAALLKYHGVAYATVRGVGLRRLGGEEGVVFVGDHGIRRTHTAARTGATRLLRVFRKANDLSREVRRLTGQRLNAFELLAHMSRADTVKALPEEKISPDPLAPLKALLAGNKPSTEAGGD